MTDDEWLEDVRDRVARGEDWEKDPSSAPYAVAVLPAPATATALRCPWCVEPSALTVFPRFEIASRQPLLYCPRCFGFWAAGDALAQGVADGWDEHPALHAHRAPALCRACAGRIDENGVCRECGERLRSLTCPSCGRPMARSTSRGVTIDACGGCNGCWFDVGEIALAFGLERPQSLAMRMVDEHAADDEPSGWLYAAEAALGLFFRFR